MKRQICISLLAASLGAPGCKAPESPIEKATATVEPAATRSPTTPKAIDPESVKVLSLDPSASRFDFVAAKITKSHNGSFKNFSGTSTLVAEELHSVALEVDTSSIEADDPQLTGHLKSPDFLDVAKFPKASFKSSSIQKKPAGQYTHEIAGALTLHGVTQELTFPATISVTPAAVTGSAEVNIDRQKFGVVYPGMPDDLIKDAVLLKPTFVFKR